MNFAYYFNSRLTMMQSAVAVLFVVSSVGCSKPETPQTKLTPVLVTTITPSEGQDQRRFTATISPRYQTALSFRVSGKVVERLVEVGQTVHSGQVLARLDPMDYSLAAKAAQDQFRAAQADANQAVSDEARFRRLMADGSVGAADHERQKTRAESALALQSQSQQNLDLANNRLKYATLTAPNAGLITDLNFEVGQNVAEGTPIAHLSQQGVMEVVFDVPEDLVNQLTSWHAQARLSTADASLTDLSLREVSPAATEPSKTFQAKYRIVGSTQAQENLKQGTNVDLILTHPQPTHMVKLPASALQQNTDHPFVWILSGEHGLKQQPVHVEKYSNDDVWLSGLQDGMRVVTAGVQKLDAGLQIDPIERVENGASNDPAYGESVVMKSAAATTTGAHQ
ncbi:MAG: efflux RND transporter periplasmic adaptor subunit [Gammaproteobacteria bacterium]|nr:efflux RND transporter periplasmic adaptor subunit [Gammaproteobacteria bacterium]